MVVNNYTKGILMATTTALLWGTTGAVAKIVSAGGLSQVTVGVYRACFTVLFLGLLLYFRNGKQVFMVSRRILKAYVLMGLFTVICMSTGYMMSCVYLSLPQAVILHYTFPLLTLAGDLLITREKPTVIQGLSAVLILVGLYVGFVMGSALGSISIIGLIWGCVSVVGFAGQNLLTRSIMKDGKTNPMVQIFYTNLFGGIMIIITKHVFFGWEDVALITPRVFLLMQHLAIVGGLIGYFFLFSSLKYIPATMASIICSLEIVGTLATMPLILGAWPTNRETIGALIILFAVIISSVMSGKRR